MSRRPTAGLGVVGGLVTGAALMYWLDPASGRRRRGLARDKLIHAGREVTHGMRVTAIDVAHRSRGMAASVATALRGDEGVSADVLVERVRAKLGRLCSHPASIEVVARDGTVELRGLVLETEHHRIVSGITQVHGVVRVDDHLEPHERGANVPSLQGAVRPGAHPELLQRNWSPAARFIVGSLAVGLAALGVRRAPRPLAIGATLAGTLLAARSALNQPMRGLVGIGDDRLGIMLQKTIRVHAPVEEVFALWRAPEQFARFMAHVKEVTPLGGGRYRWRVTGPFGIPVGWEAEIDRIEDNSLVSWKSVAGSLVKSSGTVRFEREDGATHIHLRMRYDPPGGAFGHAVVKLLRVDPKRFIDEDLLRLKSLVEDGKATARHREVRIGELGLDVVPSMESRR